MTPDESKAFIQHWVDQVWNGGQDTLIDEQIAAEYVMRSPGAPDVHGPAGFRQYISMYRSAFPDLRMTVEDLVVEGDKVAWRTRCEGTHRGELMGIPPTGRRGSTNAVIMSRFAGGRWVEDWVMVDTFGLLQQLGVLPGATATA